MAGTVVVDAVKSSTTGAPTFQNTSGTEIGQLCRAWLNYNGSTQSVLSSFNVSSVTRTGTGAYTINFGLAFSDTNFSVVANTAGASGYSFAVIRNRETVSTSSVGIQVVGQVNGTSGNTDTGYLSVSIFR